MVGYFVEGRLETPGCEQLAGGLDHHLSIAFGVLPQWAMYPVTIAHPAECSHHHTLDKWIAFIHLDG
jgi:hypothetical protein